ncbi:MAG: hypothetical protein JST67_11950 [Bacteroidetes bacterium]|nr:hypothetical protein [Bacteroidota bacterium]
MGRQINFFLLPDDADEFEKLLKSFGGVILLPYYHYDNKVGTIKDTVVRDALKEGSRVYLVRPQDFKDIKLTHIEKFGYWLVDDNSAPVLHYDRCVFKDNIVNSGRLYFQPQYVKDMSFVKKSDDFVTWADNIIKTVRRKLKKHKYKLGNYEYAAHLGQKTLTWFIENKADIGAAGHQLIPTNQTAEK